MTNNSIDDDRAAVLPMVQPPCDECQHGGIGGESSLPGVIAVLSVERCDSCEQFASDAEAEEYFHHVIDTWFTLRIAVLKAADLLLRCDAERMPNELAPATDEEWNQVVELLDAVLKATKPR